MGVVGEDFTIIATDKTQARSIMVFKLDMDKTCNIDDHKVLGLGGPQADRKVFGEYCQKNLKLYALRNGIDLSNDAAAHWVRNQLAQSLRSRSPYQVSVLLGGHDAEGPGRRLFHRAAAGDVHLEVDRAGEQRPVQRLRCDSP